VSKALDRDSLVKKYGTRSGVGTKCAVGIHPNCTLIEALVSRGVCDSRVASILRSENLPRIGEASVGRHRRKDCKCPTNP